MFSRCKYCNREFFGKGNFCSEMCEIKSHASEVVTYEKDSITHETEREFDRVGGGLPNIPILADKIVENEESPIQVRADLEISER